PSGAHFTRSGGTRASVRQGLAALASQPLDGRSIRRTLGSGSEVAELPLALLIPGGLAITRAGQRGRSGVRRDLFGSGQEEDQGAGRGSDVEPAVGDEVERCSALRT